VFRICLKSDGEALAQSPLAPAAPIGASSNSASSMFAQLIAMSLGPFV
jgi:hypothetical protein